MEKSKRGIYLVANLKSQVLCENLIYSIRKSGCNLPIRIIHFGGREIKCKYILNQAELVHYHEFSSEAKQFINYLRTVITDCPIGFLYRFLGLFSDWDEFIYSDNDIVALCNWDDLFRYLCSYDLVHADEEYTTGGIYNYERPDLVKIIFGEKSLTTAITAGHILIKKSPHLIKDICKAVEWFKLYPQIPKKHDQSLLHIASLIGEWKTLNLCKPPYNWLSSWAGDYVNSLDVIHSLQSSGSPQMISHIHYSGNNPSGTQPIHEFLFSSLNEKKRLSYLTIKLLREYSGLSYFINLIRKVFTKIFKSLR